MNILLVEDNLDVLDATSLVLRMAGHTVIRASSVQEAEEALSGAVDLMLLDLYMPGRDGWSVLQHEVPVPVIVLTGAHPGEFSKLPSYVKKVLIKPCDPADLIQALKDLETYDDRGRISDSDVGGFPE